MNRFILISLKNKVRLVGNKHFMQFPCYTSIFDLCRSLYQCMRPLMGLVTIHIIKAALILC